MSLDCPHLSLAPAWAGEDDARQIVLVEAVAALGLCRDGEYEPVAARTALWEFDRARDSLAWKLPFFVSRARLWTTNPFCNNEGDLPTRIERAIKNGDLVGLRRGPGPSADSEPTRVQRKLIHEIELRARGRLAFEGRQYRLIAGLDLPGLRDRDDYEVLPRAEAERILGASTAQAAPDLAALLTKARETLSRDWHKPFSPDGLVCLRRLQARMVAAQSPEPAMTPSQLWRRAKEEDDIIDWTIWIELDPDDPKASDDVVILLDEFYQEVERKPLAACPRRGTGVLVEFKQIREHDRFTLIRDYGPNEGGGSDTLFLDCSPAELKGQV